MSYRRLLSLVFLMVDILMGEMEPQGSFDSYFVMAKEFGYILSTSWTFVFFLWKLSDHFPQPT